MKKFLAISAVFLVAIIAIFSTLAIIKPELNFKYDQPNKVYIYAKSSVAIKNGKGESEFTPASITYKEVIEQVNEMVKISMFTHAINGNSVNQVVKQDIGNTYSSYSSSLLTKNYAVAFTFEDKQSQIVEYQGDTKKIEYFGFIIIINPELNYQEVPVYFKTTESGSYEKSPMIIYIQAKNILEYINSVK